MRKKVICITAMILAISSSTTVLATNNKTIDSNNEKIESLNKDNKVLTNRQLILKDEVKELIISMSKKQEEISVIQDKVDLLQKEVDVLQANIDSKQVEINDKVLEISKNEDDMNKKELEKNEQSNLLSSRLQRNYMNDTYNQFLGIIFDSNSLSDAMFKLKFVTDAVKADKEAIESLKKMQQELLSAKNDLVANKKDLEAKKSALEFQKNTINEKKGAVEEEKSFLNIEYSNLQYLESQKQEKISAIEREKGEINNDIFDLESENERIRAAMEEASRPPSTGGSGNISSGNESSIGFIKPTSGRYTSPYGTRIHPITGQKKMHTGIDIAAPLGTPVNATAAGTVTAMNRNNGAWGNQIIIKHSNGYASMYAHLNSFNVKVGDVVKQGQTVGKMGTTGWSTGSHLHFEIWKNGSHTNPRNYF